MKLWEDIKGMFGGKTKPAQEAAAPSVAAVPPEDPAATPAGSPPKPNP